MPMNIVIQEQRRLLGLTQEQLLLNVTIILDSLLLQTADDTLPIDSLDTKISG